MLPTQINTSSSTLQLSLVGTFIYPAAIIQVATTATTNAAIIHTKSWNTDIYWMLLSEVQHFAKLKDNMTRN